MHMHVPILARTLCLSPKYALTLLGFALMHARLSVSQIHTITQVRTHTHINRRTYKHANIHKRSHVLTGPFSLRYNLHLLVVCSKI